MKKLLKTILNAPSFTTNEIETIFTAKKLMKLKNTFAHALLANDAVTGRKISAAFIRSAAIFEEIEKLDKNINAAWHQVQIQKTKKKDRKEFSADDAMPIAIAILPDDMSIDELKKIKAYLEALHYTLQPLIAEPSTHDYGYGKFDNIIAQLECAITAKLPRELQGYPSNEDDSHTLEEPLIPATPVLSDDVIATIENLKKQDELEIQSPDEDNVIKNKAQAQKAMVKELSRAYAQQRELTLAYRFNNEFNQYKNVLSKYIKEKLETNDNALYLRCFTEPTVAPSKGLLLKTDPIAEIAIIINKNDDQIVDARELNIKQFAKENLNFSRAVVNYKLIHDAQIKLHPQNPEESKPEHLVERLKNFYQDHSTIDQSLQQVGYAAVDKATSGIKGFFKKIFSSINWYFSEVGKKEREVKAFAKYNREHFFSVTQTRAPAVPEQVALTSTPRPSPAA